ncbi:MAG: beta-hydroxyacyl-ACP dehydratase [Bacteroidaceae bacterium]|nr:beta-hydroxyacyl-ACP dehydratase [Bacteroidaceae bacterium]
MLLKDKFFSIENTVISNDGVTYQIRLLSDCDCYRGHFPGKPVSPGVCNIEMIRECAELFTGKDLFIEEIKQCRLTAVSSPAICPSLDVAIKLIPASDNTAYEINASITDQARTYMSLKGIFRTKQ